MKCKKSNFSWWTGRPYYVPLWCGFTAEASPWAVETERPECSDLSTSWIAILCSSLSIIVWAHLVWGEQVIFIKGILPWYFNCDWRILNHWRFLLPWQLRSPWSSTGSQVDSAEHWVFWRRSWFSNYLRRERWREQCSLSRTLPAF